MSAKIENVSAQRGFIFHTRANVILKNYVSKVKFPFVVDFLLGSREWNIFQGFFCPQVGLKFYPFCFDSFEVSTMKKH